MGKLTSPLPKKYKYRKEQILNIVALSGEIPTDLYKQLNMTKDNFKKICSNLKKEGLIKSVITRNVHGYVLQLKGKQYLRKQSRIELYFQDIQTQTINIQQRKRNHQLARIFVILDLLDIPYEPSKKPSREMFNYKSSDVVFYTAQEYKQEQEERSKGFQGSRFKGLLIGCQKILPVYLANQHLINFHRTEISLINQIGKDYLQGGKIESAVIFCSDKLSAANIFSEINNYEDGKGTVDITSSSYYDEIVVVPLDENLSLAFQSIYKEERIKEFIKHKYQIKPGSSESIYDGILKGSEVLIAVNIEVIRISRYLSDKADKNETAYVFCYEYMKPIIERHISEFNQDRDEYEPKLTARIQTIKAEEIQNEYGVLTT